VLGDAGLIGQAIGNLLENALRHTPTGSHIALAVDADAGRPRLWVSGDGPGIPEAKREDVLRHFYRLETSRTTPGSGLAIVAAVVNRPFGGYADLSGVLSGCGRVADRPFAASSVPNSPLHRRSSIMAARPPNRENHYINRIGWLRAAVLGANDGILSTGSLVVGVASAAADHKQVLITGFAGLIAGAMSMATGEYVSVSSQTDTEKADLNKEAEELKSNPAAEQRELAMIYVKRGLEPELARQVAAQLMANDALEAHARDELGISETMKARPVQAAVASAASFAAGAVLPVAAAAITPSREAVWIVSAVSLIGLCVLGAVGAKAGGAPPGRAMVRVVFWGALAMAITGAAGALFGART
jgi:vacuolar iron transporter family protein